jgi:tetratricopeptide (TPR) repeat protein
MNPMSDQKRKSLDEFSDESDQFESQFERLFEAEGDESGRKRLVADIGDWLQGFAKQGRFIPLASADRRAFRSLLERWNSRLRRQGFSVEGIDELSDFEPNAGIVLTGVCPYPGLDPYTQESRFAFFGREQLVSGYVSHLEQQGNRILLIIGASGSGKSSVALAGILPRLVEHYAGAWLFGPRLTPGAHPLAELAASVAQAIGHPDQAAEIERGLAAEPGGALGRLAELCRDKPLMLLIDQFEELVTLCRDSGEQSAFAKVLCALSDPDASVRGFSCRILLTLRTDHLARLENNKALQPLHRRLVNENNERYLSAIGFSDIKRAIKEPADDVGLRFIPPGLIDQLASQTAGLSNGLPLLQFSLRRLWDTRPKHESGEPLDLVTEKMVKDLPDVERALGMVADGVFRTFSAPQQKICERLLLELLVLDESFEEPLRRRRNEAEITEVLRMRFLAEEDIARVIADFVAAGLLRRFGDMPNSQLEVSHEALLRHWDHIYRILTGAEVKGRLHLIKQIGREAGDWANHDKSSDLLKLKGEQLNRAITYAEEGWLAQEEATAYVDACRKQDEVAKKAKRQAVQFQYGFLLALLVLALTIVVFLWERNSEMEGVALEMKRIADANDHVSYGFYYLNQNNDLKNAEKKFREADALGQEQLLLAKVALGLIFLLKEDYNNAKLNLENVISLALKKEEQEDSKKDPVLYTYYYYMGKSCSGLELHEEGRNAFKRAIGLMIDRSPDDKNLAEYHYQLGLSHLKLGEVEYAEKAFNKGVDLIGSKEAANRDGLGQVYLRQGNTEAARNQFEKAINLAKNEYSYLAKNEYSYHFNLGLAYVFGGNWEEVVKVFGNLIEKNPEDASAWLYLSQAYVSLEEKSKAERKNKEAVEFSKKAEDAANKALSIRELTATDRPKAYTLLGDSLAVQGKYKEAIEAYKEARKINPKDAFLAVYLADAYTESMNWQIAEDYLKEAKEFARTDLQLKQMGAEAFFNQRIKKLEEKLNSPR